MDREMKTLGEQFALEMSREHFNEAVRRGDVIYAAKDCFEKIRQMLGDHADVRLCEAAEPDTFYTVNFKAMEANLKESMFKWGNGK